jgi:hypothetical protein
MEKFAIQCERGETGVVYTLPEESANNRALLFPHHVYGERTNAMSKRRKEHGEHDA